MHVWTIMAVLQMKVSAWVGFHYFACRPYYEIPVTLTSSSGNAWLVKALLKNISSSKTQWNTVLAGLKSTRRSRMSAN